MKKYENGTSAIIQLITISCFLLIVKGGIIVIVFLWVMYFASRWYSNEKLREEEEEREKERIAKKLEYEKDPSFKASLEHLQYLMDKDTRRFNEAKRQNPNIKEMRYKNGKYHYYDKNGKMIR